MTALVQLPHAQQGAAPPARSSWASRLFAPAAAALAGGLLYLSLPPRPLWWLAPVAFALLAASLHSRRIRAGFGYSYLTGLGCFLPLLVWTGVEVGPVPWLALAAVQAVFVAVAGAGIAAVSRLPGWPFWAAAACPSRAG